jgi:uncharacterized paraquat-inducible protein A
MSVERGTDGPEAIRVEERIRRADRVATGTFACPACDVPVAPAGRMSPAQRVACPYCGHSGAVRDFLSLAAPSRPARVAVRVVHR